MKGWFAEAARLGALEHERATIERRGAAPADVLKARNTWIRAMSALRAALSLVDNLPSALAQIRRGETARNTTTASGLRCDRSSRATTRRTPRRARGTTSSRVNHPRSGVALALLFTLTSETSVFAQPRDDRARVVTSRLLAPCCYQQTLDVHESPLATELREEVDARLRAGQTPAQIEARLVSRYGERMRAVPRDHDPRGYVLALVAVAMAAAAALLLRATRRWSRSVGRPASPAPTTRDALDDRLDDELRALDD